MLQAFYLLPRTARRHRDMLRSFVWRDLASRYEGSMLGRLWPLIYPLILLGIYHLVFAEFLGLKFAEGQNPVVGQGWVTTFYMLSGILPWLAFADTLARSTNVVVENNNLIKKIAFPSELLPTYVAITQVVHFAISMAFFLGLYLIVTLSAGLSDGAPLLANLWYLPIPALLQFVLGLGLGMLLSTVNVFARDLNQMMPIGLLLWMLVSPIFYPIQMLEWKVRGNPNGATPEQIAGTGEEWMLTLMNCNPIYHLLEMYRAVFRSNEDTPFPWESCGIFAAIAGVVFCLGYWSFVKSKGLFADEV